LVTDQIEEKITTSAQKQELCLCFSRRKMKKKTCPEIRVTEGK